MVARFSLHVACTSTLSGVCAYRFFVLMWPLYLVLQRDYLTRFKLIYRRWNWHRLARDGGKESFIYFGYVKLMGNPIGRQLLKGWMEACTQGASHSACARSPTVSPVHSACIRQGSRRARTPHLP